MTTRIRAEPAEFGGWTERFSFFLFLCYSEYSVALRAQINEDFSSPVMPPGGGVVSPLRDTGIDCALISVKDCSHANNVVFATRRLIRRRIQFNLNAQAQLRALRCNR